MSSWFAYWYPSKLLHAVYLLSHQVAVIFHLLKILENEEDKP